MKSNFIRLVHRPGLIPQVTQSGRGGPGGRRRGGFGGDALPVFVYAPFS